MADDGRELRGGEDGDDERLAALESEIEGGLELVLRGWTSVGIALREIKEAELFKKAGFADWETYCRGRWRWSARNADRKIQVATLVGPFGLENEAQARELIALAQEVDEDELVVLVRELREKYGDELTAEKIKRDVERPLERARQNKDEREALASDAAAIIEEMKARPPASPGEAGGRRVVLYQGDSREVIPLEGVIEDESVTTIVTDPPYGTGDEGGGGAVKHGKIEGNIDLPTAMALLGGVLEDLEPKMARDAWALIFCDPRYFSFMWQVVKDSGYLSPTEFPGIWWKLAPGHRRKDTPYRSSYESFIVARKGNPSWGPPAGGGIEDVLACRRVPWQRREHHHFHEKPLGLISKLVRDLCPPDGLVVDPFAGSGTTLVAADLLDRRAVGVEIDKIKFAAAYRRGAGWRTATKEARMEKLQAALDSVLQLDSTDALGHRLFDEEAMPSGLRDRAREINEGISEINEGYEEALEAYAAQHGQPPPPPSVRGVLLEMLERFSEDDEGKA